MASNFCAQCGNRLAEGARFCASCGSPVEVDSALPPDDAQFFERLGIKVLVTGAVRDKSETKCYDMLTHDLNTLMACSFMNAPLETEFLLVRNSQQEWTRWTPLVCIDDMQGLEALCSAAVHYAFLNIGDRHVYDHIRSAVIPEVRDTYIKLNNSLRIHIKVFLHFDARNYGKLEPAVRAGWITAYNSASNLYTVTTATPFPLSGRTMKQRLVEHESWLNEACGTYDQWRENLSKVLSFVRSLIQQMPDGPAHEIECIAYGQKDRQNVHLVLSKNDWAESARPVHAAPSMGAPLAAQALEPASLDSTKLTFQGLLAGVAVPRIARVCGSSSC